jgi:hypothetical protein
MKVLSALALVVLVGGCGSATQPLVGGTGGDAGAEVAAAPRLVPWQLETEGAPPLVVGIYDAQEKVHCRFLPDEAGQLRCLPWAVGLPSYAYAFSEPTCQRPVYQVSQGQGLALAGRPIATPLPRKNCEATRYAVGTVAILPATATLYGGTPCAPLDRADTSSSVGFVNISAGAVESRERWATGTEVDGPTLSVRVRVRQVVAPGGTRFNQRLVDDDWKKPCTMQQYGGAPTCWPQLISNQMEHEGTDCMGPPVWFAWACENPAAIQIPGSGGPNLFALGPQWTGPVSSFGHFCSVGPLRTDDGPAVYFEKGARLDTTIAAMEWRTTGQGRLVLRTVGNGDGPSVALDDEIAPPNDWIAPRYLDTSTHLDCDPRWTIEGRVRCVPTNVAVDQAPFGAAFADDQCKTPAYVCPSYASQCDGAVVMSTVVDANGESRASALTAARQLPGVYTLDAQGACAPGSFPPFGFYVPGPALPWDTYPALTEVNGRASGAP